MLNDHPNVRPQTREDVLAAIRELGYRPNAAARTLVTGRTHTLGLITSDTALYASASMLYGIERAAHPGTPACRRSNAARCGRRSTGSSARPSRGSS